VEGVVIVGSILLAFGIDAWWDARGDRVTERQYLERLLEDVRFDRAEGQLVQRRLGVAIEAADRLLDRIESTGLSGSDVGEWLPWFVNGSRPATPDYSRSTYQELIASGRIELIRSPIVRSTLADYDRLILNLQNRWRFEALDRGFYRMRYRWQPQSVLDAVRTCADSPSRGGCLTRSLDSIDWDPSPLAARLTEFETTRDIREARSTNASIAQAVEFLGELAAALEDALLTELGRRD
jgi:hypothetical protein